MRFKLIIALFILTTVKEFAQIDSSASNFEIYIIDSYITPEIPRKFVLSFFTSDSCTSKLVLLDKYFFDVSKKLSENHSIEIELNKFKFDSSGIKYEIIAINKSGKEYRSEKYNVELPKELVITPEQDIGLFNVCLGGIVFAIPSVSSVRINNQNYWSISKEIPLFSFYSVGYNYPAGYISAEYSHIFNSEKKNFLWIGYKHIFQISSLEYISPGINYFTDFLGFNGSSIELTLGLFKIRNAFTFYTRYRYNFQFQNSETNFHEYSVGLFSNFFSLNF